VKLAIIGGGSSYAPGLLRAFIDCETFNGSRIVLQDINADTLGVVTPLVRKLAANAGGGIEISATTNLEGAIDGADYVLTTCRPGGFECRAQDERIPLQFGIYGQETCGPGGFFFAARSLPVLREITGVMAKRAPHAILVNYTNPTQIIAEAVTRYTDVPAISICDQSIGDIASVLGALGKANADVRFTSIGLNHATWSEEFSIDGEDGVAVMNRAHDDIVASEADERLKGMFALAKRFGAMPNSYLPYYYYMSDFVRRAQDRPTRAQVIMGELDSYFDHYREQAAAGQPKLTHVRGGSDFGDMAVDVIGALATRDGSEHILNVPNQGAIPNLPFDTIVEMPCRITPTGVERRHFDALADWKMALIGPLSVYQRLAAEAIWHGNRSLALTALATNPMVRDLGVAERLFDAFHAQQSRHYPAFS
jgi:6-phospho-beta-glucosidase